MLTHTLSALVFTAVGVGVSLQVLALAFVGTRLARKRVSKQWQQWRSVPRRSTTAPASPVSVSERQRCRDYRLALRRANEHLPRTAA